MTTELMFVDSPYSNNSVIQQAARYIQTGKLVVFPTETVFGLGADALNKVSCQSIYIAKGRPVDNPLILHIADSAQLSTYAANIPDYAFQLIDALCPGPVTFLFNKTHVVPDWVTANQQTVCIRIPSHPVARELIKLSHTPLVAPSANTSTRPSATTAQHAYDDLHGKVDLILDSAIKPLGIESTIIDCTAAQPSILRYGIITPEDVSGILHKQITLANPQESDPITPGSKYKHYAPNVRVVAFTAETSNLGKKVLEFCKSNQQVRILSTRFIKDIEIDIQHVYPDSNGFVEHLFTEFRQAEKDGVEVLFVSLLPNSNIGYGVNERILKAAEASLK